MTSQPNYSELPEYLLAQKWARFKAQRVDWDRLSYHNAQRQIAEHAARFKVVVCGRRFGKTELAIDKIGHDANTQHLPYAYFAPTYKMLAEVWRDMKYTLLPAIANKSEQEKRIIMHGGGIIDCWSWDNPDAARGRKYAGVVLDEFSLNSNPQFWTAVVRPTLTDYRGWAWFLGTPKGRNAFWQLYQHGLDPTATDWQSWTFPTAANPFIDKDEIAAARHELPEDIFRQEYLAEFLEGEGQVFRKIRDAATLQRKEPYAGEFVAGLDWAQQHDFTVMMVMDKQTGEVVDYDRFNQISWHVQRGRVKAMATKWNVSIINGEENSIGSPNVEQLQREGLPIVGFMTTQQSKTQIIESLVLAFEREEIKILNDPVIIGELEAYERKVSKVTGRSQYSAPSGLHDDCVIALALAWKACTDSPAVLARQENPFYR